MWRSAEKLKVIVSGIVLVAVGSYLTATNPTFETYNNYASEIALELLQIRACHQISTVGKDFLSDQCKNIIRTNKPAIKTFLAENTIRENFILFSIYQTDLSLSEILSELTIVKIPNLPTYKFKTIGILNKFFIYQKPKL